MKREDDLQGYGGRDEKWKFFAFVVLRLHLQVGKLSQIIKWITRVSSKGGSTNPPAGSSMNEILSAIWTFFSSSSLLCARRELCRNCKKRPLKKTFAEPKSTRRRTCPPDMHGHGKHQHIATQPYFAKANRGSHETRPKKRSRDMLCRHEWERKWKCATFCAKEVFSHCHFHFRLRRMFFSFQIKLDNLQLNWLARWLALDGMESCELRTKVRISLKPLAIGISRRQAKHDGNEIFTDFPRFSDFQK